MSDLIRERGLAKLLATRHRPIVEALDSGDFLLDAVVALVESETAALREERDELGEVAAARMANEANAIAREMEWRRRAERAEAELVALREVARVALEERGERDGSYTCRICGANRRPDAERWHHNDCALSRLTPAPAESATEPPVEDVCARCNGTRVLTNEDRGSAPWNEIPCPWCTHTESGGGK